MSCSTSFPWLISFCAEVTQLVPPGLQFIVKQQNMGNLIYCGFNRALTAGLKLKLFCHNLLIDSFQSLKLFQNSPA